MVGEPKRVGVPPTTHSAATTFLPTPSLRANRRARDFTQNTTLDTALSQNAASTLVSWSLVLMLVSNFFNSCVSEV